MAFDAKQLRDRITTALVQDPTQLNLQGALVGAGVEGIKIVVETLQTNTTLTTLNLEGNNLGVAGGKALAEALKTNKTLTTLDLWNNNLGVEGGKALAEALKTNKTLTVLNLEYNNLGVEEGKALAESLKTNKTLTTLNLSDNNLGAEGGKALAEALKTNTTLTTLNLAYNNLGAEGGKALAEALKTNTTLTTLNLAYNNLGAEEAGILAECEALLARNRALQQNWAKIAVTANAVVSNKTLGGAAQDLLPTILSFAGFKALAKAPTSTPDKTSDQDKKTADDKDKKSTEDVDKKNTGDVDKKTAAAAASSTPKPLQPAFNIQKFRGSLFFAHLVEELQKSSAGSSKLPNRDVNALPDGNCAFNAMVLGVCDLIVHNQIADPNLYKTLGESLKIASDRPSFLTWHGSKSSPELQRTLAPIFRKLAIEHIEAHYPHYQESYQAALQAAFDQFKLNGVKDESFCTHPFILAKFTEVKQQISAKDSKTTDEELRQELIRWWDTVAKQQYFDTLKQPAQSAGQLESWGGDVEISALANVFKLNIQAKKEQQTQMLGVGFGLVEKLSAEDIAQLEALRLGTRYHNAFRIEQTGEQLKNLLDHPGLTAEEVKCLDEAGKRSLLAFKNPPHTPLPSHLVALHPKLEQLGVFCTASDKTFRFINDATLCHLVKPVSVQLKTQVLNAHRSNPPGFQIEHAKNHWSYRSAGLQGPKIPQGPKL